MVQRKNYASGPQMQMLRFACQCGRNNTGVGRKPADGMKVPFRNPNCLEAILVSKFGRFQNDFIFVGMIFGLVVPEKIDAEVYRITVSREC